MPLRASPGKPVLSAPARLRNWILVLAGLLLVAITAFFLHARWLGRLLSRDVPYELAKTIQQSTQGFTHSESRGGHTIYTLHASKAVQFKSDGHAELHDVSITLFNAQGAPANRIRGSAFDWDPVHGIARALGEVQIDLEGNAAAGAGPGKQAAEDGEGKSTIHVKTSGLIFNKQTGLASTTEKIEFRLSAAAGSAVGASFNSQTGVMILDSQVAFNSSVGGSTLSVRAHHAQFDRESRLLYLLQDETDFADNHSSSGEATISFRNDGSAYQVEAEGSVILTGSSGQTINTRKAHIDLGAKSEPQQARVEGGLLYVANGPTRQLHGTATSGTMLLGPQMTIRHAQLQDAVSLVDAETLPAASNPKAGQSKKNPPESSTRQVQATRVDIDFKTGPDRSPQAERILATGGARLNVHTVFASTPPQDTTVKGDQLLATLVEGETLSSLRGTGHTSLADVSPTGVTQTTTGDNLLLTFAPQAGQTTQARAVATTPPAIAQLQTAVQQGNVTLTQQTPQEAKGKKGVGATGQTIAVTTASAGKAAYDVATQTVQLTGNPRIHNASGELSAGSIELEHTSGNANATDGVKATYQQTKGQVSVPFSSAGSVHVVADHAHLDHATELTTFYGKTGDAARLWQGSDSIAAPVLELSRAHATLSAHGSGDGAAVTAILTSQPGSQPNATATVVRLRSRTLFYADNDHQATVSGAVVAQTSTGTLRANSMDIYFTRGAALQPTGKTPDQPGSQVEKIVARGAVRLQQPGRTGSGEQLTWTAADSRFVLTGTPGEPPRLSDQARGTVTGTSLIFNDRDDSVIVSGGPSKAVTQTRVAR